jgi:hypothetical protein
MTRLEKRGGVAIAFMAMALRIMLLIAAWEYLHLCHIWSELVHRWSDNRWLSRNMDECSASTSLAAS